MLLSALLVLCQFSPRVDVGERVGFVVESDFDHAQAGVPEVDLALAACEEVGAYRTSMI